METSIQIKTFLKSVLKTKFCQTFSKYFRRLKRTLIRQSPLLPVSSPSTNPSFANEEVHDSTVRVRMPDQQIVDRPEKVDWAMIVIGFCMESAVDRALQSVQNHDDHKDWKFHLLSLLILFTSAALFVAKLLRRNLGNIAQALEGVGLLLAVSAFCHAISIPLPFALKCITWATFGISLLALLISKYCSKF